MIQAPRIPVAANMHTSWSTRIDPSELLYDFGTSGTMARLLPDNLSPLFLPPNSSGHTCKSGGPRSLWDSHNLLLWWESPSELRHIPNIQQHIIFALKFDEESPTSLDRSATWAPGTSIQKSTESIIITTTAIISTIIIICKMPPMYQAY